MMMMMMILMILVMLYTYSIHIHMQLSNDHEILRYISSIKKTYIPTKYIIQYKEIKCTVCTCTWSPGFDGDGDDDEEWRQIK